ncbi:porin family protein [Winogradskyella sp.]|uniref:porin family protein n=1 Tax=Winogradskyella sp. TaxID=1883156 RepID=UPI00262E6A64|nr:porin family protein [Winogradskyella sp.]
MKKSFLLAITLVLFTLKGIAQDDSNTNTSTEPKFGIKAGYSSLTLRVSLDGTSASENVSGFYVGFFSEFGISDKFGIQPELHYASYSEDGENSDVLILPVLAEYKVNEKFHLQAGPQFDYILNEEDAIGLNRLGIGVALGASYDITENIILDTRYSFALSNRINDDELILNGLGAGEFDTVIGDFDVKARFNYFQIGLGYRF